MINSSIALLPGDGIGPQVVDAAAKVLETVARLFGHSFEMRAWQIGGAALAAGRPALPPETLNACLQADAVLLGAVGSPEFDHLPPATRPENALLALRRELQVYANLRPARVWPGLEALSPIKPDRLAGTDLLIVRELTGGLYFGEPRRLDLIREAAVNTLAYSGGEIERVAVVAFEAARQRRKKVTLVDKANVLETSQLWRHIVPRVASRYPDVQLDFMYVDACALALVLDPRPFDVILTENLFGDILSDEAGAIAGSIGLLPSASLGGKVGLFEPVHGSAPALVATNAANPVGAIASAAMLLRHGFRAEDEARAIETAIEKALVDKCLTADLIHGTTVEPLTCTEMTEAIIERIGPRRSLDS